MSGSKVYKEYDQCPICGDPLLKHKKDPERLLCDCCGFNVSLVCEIKHDDEERLRQAQDALRSYEFDRAEDRYNLILDDNPSTSEVYLAALFGKLLAEFGVIYIKDTNGEMIPTFSEYNPEFKSIKKSKIYEALRDLEIDNKIKESYLSKIDKLDDVYKRIDREIKAQDEYDVFICTKITRRTPRHPDFEGYTEDSRIADNFYHSLKKKGLKVFYSDRCCNEVEYDSQILSALLKSKKILIIATEKDYLESPWVQSEWRRWLNFISYDLKEKNSVCLYLPHYEKDAFELPRVLRKVQRYSISLKVLDVLSSDIENKEKLEEEKRIKALKEAEARTEKTRLETEELLRKLQERLNNETKALEEAKNKKLEENKLKAQEAKKAEEEIKRQEEAKRVNEEKRKELERIEAKRRLQEEKKKAEAKKRREEARLQEEKRILEENKEDYQLGLKFLNKKEFTKAYECFEKASSRKDAPSKVSLGDMYYNGFGVSQDYNKALELYLEAAKLKSSDAEYNIGSIYYLGFGVNKDLKEAFKWYKKSALKGHLDAIVTLGIMYQNGEGTSKNLSNAFKCFEFASKNDKVDGFHCLAEMYEYGYFVPKDLDKARDLYKIASDKGNTNSTEKYITFFPLKKRAEMFFKGIDVEVNYDRARACYEHLNLSGKINQTEKCNLAYIYYNLDKEAYKDKIIKLLDGVTKLTSETKKISEEFGLNKKTTLQEEKIEEPQKQEESIKQEETPKVITTYQHYYEGHPVVFGILTLLSLVITFLLKDIISSPINFPSFVTVLLLNLGIIPMLMGLTNLFDNEDIKPILIFSGLGVLILETTIYFSVIWIWWIVIFIALMIIYIVIMIYSESESEYQLPNVVNGIITLFIVGVGIYLFITTPLNEALIAVVVGLIVFALEIILTNTILDFDKGVMRISVVMLSLLLVITLAVYFSITWIWWIVVFIALSLTAIIINIFSYINETKEPVKILYAIMILFTIATVVYLFFVTVWYHALVVLGAEALLLVGVFGVCINLEDCELDPAITWGFVLGIFVTILLAAYFASTWIWWIVVFIAYIVISVLIQLALTLNAHGEKWYIFVIILGILITIITACVLFAIEMWIMIVVGLVELALTIGLAVLCYKIDDIAFSLNIE